jgi:predicted O-methyltransferase YrrM
MIRFRMTYKFILHFLTAKNSHGFGVHSPYVFQFTNDVLYNRNRNARFTSIEKIRSNLKKNTNCLDIVDYGTGIKQKKSIAEIAVKSVKPAKYGQLLYRLSEFIKSHSTLELGTSFGLTTSYLASSSSTSRVVSLEGSQQIVDIAKENFKILDIKNIQVVTGNIDQTLSKVLNEFDQLELVFVDANHKSKAVLTYFEMILSKVYTDSIVVIDDIYWSSDMEYAWKVIKEHPRVTSTIDLFQMGIVFFNSDLHKKHYKMRI